MCTTVNDDPRLKRLEAELAASEAARRQAERSLAATQAMGRIGDWEWDLRQDRLRWSDELYRLYGLEAGCIARMADYLAHLPPDGRARVERTIAQLLAERAPVVSEFTIERPDGAVRHLQARMRLALDDDGQPTTLHGVMQDITERKAIEGQLRSSEQLMRAIFEHTPDIITVRDREGRYMMVNPGFYRLCPGQTDVIGLSDAEIFGADSAMAIRETDLAVLDEGRVVSYELPLSRHGEAAGTFLITKHPYYGPEGDRVGVMSIGRDITERAETERLQRAQIIRLQELDRLKSGFVGTVSHELRTPLTSIRGYAEFLSDGVAGTLNQHQAGYVEQIELAARRLGAVVDDLLDFARLDAGTFKLHVATSDLGEKVREVIEGFGPQLAEAGLSLDAQLPPGPLPAEADPQRIAQVLTNLMGNAIKFSPPGGAVRVILQADEARLRVAVVDQGPGIADEDRAKLFVRFGRLDNAATRATSGTGLGLSISKVIVEGHGGTIGVESRLGEGATFWFELPRHRGT